MPNIQSAVKRARQSAENRVRNRKEKSTILTTRRVFLASLESGDKKKAFDEFRRYCSVLDKASKKGIIKKNNADRKKERAAAKIAQMKAE